MSDENPYAPPEASALGGAGRTDVALPWRILAVAELLVGVVVSLMALAGTFSLALKQHARAEDWTIHVCLLLSGAGFTFAAWTLRRGRFLPQMIWILVLAALGLFVHFG